MSQARVTYEGERATVLKLQVCRERKRESERAREREKKRGRERVREIAGIPKEPCNAQKETCRVTYEEERATAFFLGGGLQEEVKELTAKRKEEEERRLAVEAGMHATRAR